MYTITTVSYILQAYHADMGSNGTFTIRIKSFLSNNQNTPYIKSSSNFKIKRAIIALIQRYILYFIFC